MTPRMTPERRVEVKRVVKLIFQDNLLNELLTELEAVETENDLKDDMIIDFVDVLKSYADGVQGYDYSCRDAEDVLKETAEQRKALGL